MKQFCVKVDFIIDNHIKSYTQTLRKNWYKIVYVNIIDLYSKCMWFYNKMNSRIKFYRSNYYRITIWMHIFHAVKCINMHQNTSLSFLKIKKWKNWFFWETLLFLIVFWSCFYVFEYLFLKISKIVLIFIHRLNCMCNVQLYDDCVAIWCVEVDYEDGTHLEYNTACVHAN